MTNLPADLPKGKVVGRFVVATVDSAEDQDPYPDGSPFVGAVTFTMHNRQLIRGALLVEPTTVYVDQFTFTFDEDGYLIDAEGNQGAWLPCGVYTLAFDVELGKVKSYDVEILPEHDDATPLDLTGAMPPDAKPAFGWEQAFNEIYLLTSEVRNDAAAAAQDASNAADSSQQSADAAAQSAQDAQQAMQAQFATQDEGVADLISTAAGPLTQTALDNYTASLGKTLWGGNNAATDAANLTATLSAAATLGVPVVLRGDFLVGEWVQVPAGATIEGRGATITQTAALTPALVVGGSHVRISGLTLNGLTTDYEHTSSVYGASAITADAAGVNLTISDCRMTGWAGAAVNIKAEVDGITIESCTMTGPGPTYILDSEYRFSAGIRCLSSGRLTVRGCDISAFAQGIIGSKDQADITITGNHIHDIPGQHGAYLSATSRLVFADNLIHDCGSTGMKVQNSLGAGDSLDLSITGNVVVDTGAQGILLTNADKPDSTTVLRRFVITGNVCTRNGRGIEVQNSIGGVMADNIITDATSLGISLSSSSGIKVTDNRVDTTGDQGILVTDLTDSEISHNRVRDAGQLVVSSTSMGIHAQGACVDVAFDGNRITDSTASMRTGMYLNVAAPETLTVRSNRVATATHHGFRMATSTASLREYRDNDFNGPIAELNPPTSGLGSRQRETFGAAAPTSGTWAVGDRAWHTAPVAGGNVGWVCTAAGTPGTWTPFGSIAQ